MTVPPEIKRLRDESERARLWTAADGERLLVLLSDAEQAVRDTEARVNDEWAASDYVRQAMSDARREAFREAVEALLALAARRCRGFAPGLAGSYAVREAADFLERQFLTSEGEDDGR